jgi:hypothetical protein
VHVSSPAIAENGENPPDPASARRLGSRAPTHFLVFVRDGSKRVRARAAQLSTTGVVIDVRFSEGLDLERLQQLELAIPGRPRPIQVLARPVRKVGRLLAYEFLSIKEVDQLSLAEHLDNLNRPGWA